MQRLRVIIQGAGEFEVTVFLTNVFQNLTTVPLLASAIASNVMVPRKGKILEENTVLVLLYFVNIKSTEHS